jgi:hypothetical protein
MNGDNKWTVVSAIAAVAGLFLPLIIFFIGRDIKELTVETVSRSVLVDLSNPLLSALKLTYNDVPVGKLTVATIELRNSGNRPIEQTDFERAINLRFPTPGNVLTATLSEKAPIDLMPKIVYDSNHISIDPLLLNPGDLFRITVQFRGDFSEPIVETRISNVPSITRKTYEGSNLYTRRALNGIFQIAFGIVGILTYFYFAMFLSTALIYRRAFIAIPVPLAWLVVTALLGNSVFLYIVGKITLELPEWPANGVVVLIALGIMIPLGTRAAIRLDKAINR